MQSAVFDANNLMRPLLIACLMLLLAACGGAASQNAGIPVPTVDVSGLAVSSFKATLTGTVTGEFSGMGSTFKQEQGGVLIRLVGAQGPSSPSITVILPAGTVAGSYTSKSYADAYDSAANKITGIGASFSVANATGGMEATATISEGVLTLQSVDPMTGSIHFKAHLTAAILRCKRPSMN